MILSTDMAKHSIDLSSLNALFTENGIIDGQNISHLTDNIDNSMLFKN